MTSLKERVELELSNVPRTARMYELEREHGLPILTLIWPNRGVSSGQLAEELGVSKSTLSEWRTRFGVQEMVDINVVPPGPKAS